MPTARDLVQRAAISAGVVESVDNLSNEDAVSALNELNNIVEIWNLDSLFPNTNLEYTFTPPALTSGEIKIGPTTGSVDIEAPRPNRVVAVATLRDGRYYALNYISPDDVATSNVRNALNQGVYSDYYSVYMDYPDITIKLYPYSDSDSYLITTQGVVPTFTLNDNINLPSGYFPALQYELASVLALNFGNVEMLPLLEKRALECISRVKRLNNKTRLLSQNGTPGRGATEFDIRSGTHLT